MEILLTNSAFHLFLWIRHGRLEECSGRLPHGLLYNSLVSTISAHFIRILRYPYWPSIIHGSWWLVGKYQSPIERDYTCYTWVVRSPFILVLLCTSRWSTECWKPWQHWKGGRNHTSRSSSSCPSQSVVREQGCPNIW